MLHVEPGNMESHGVLVTASKCHLTPRSTHMNDTWLAAAGWLPIAEARISENQNVLDRLES